MTDTTIHPTVTIPAVQAQFPTAAATAQPAREIKFGDADKPFKLIRETEKVGGLVDARRKKVEADYLAETQEATLPEHLARTQPRQFATYTPDLNKSYIGLTHEMESEAGVRQKDLRANASQIVKLKDELAYAKRVSKEIEEARIEAARTVAEDSSTTIHVFDAGSVLNAVANKIGLFAGLYYGALTGNATAAICGGLLTRAAVKTFASLLSSANTLTYNNLQTPHYQR